MAEPRGIGTLLHELVEESATLLRNESRLVKLESTRAATAIGRGSSLVALGGVCVVLGGLSLVTGLALLAGDQWLPADRYWLAALLGLAIAAALAMTFMKRAKALLSPAELVPKETATTLREDAQWLKRQTQ